jgi:type IV pilus assembly protein PilC
MKRFSYLALNSQGQEVTGQLEAADQDAAVLALRKQGLRVLEIKARWGSSGFMGQANFSDWLASQRSVSTSALIFFFRQLSFMLRSGLSLAHALTLAKDQISSPRLNLVIRLMLKDIESGHALSQTMKKHPQVFSEMAINLVLAGETTGDLGIMMERLADHISKKAALRAQVINAMIYPAVVVIAAIGVGVFMVVKIIPKFAKFLLGKGRALPPSTQALIDMSDYLRSNGLFIIGGLIALIVALLLVYQTRRGRLVIDSLLLRVPVMGSLLVNAAMAQMSWTLSILLRSGITIFDAMKVTANLLPNRVYFNQLHKASEQILQGRDVAKSLAHPQIPPLVLQMIAVGENSGSLDDILQELGVYYEDLLEIAIKRLSAMIEPAMILVIGSMVGFVYYAFFQALFSLVGGK